MFLGSIWNSTASLCMDHALPNVSKTYEKFIQNQIQRYFDKIFSKYQCGFRKSYNSHHCLIEMTEKWRKREDKGGSFGALLTDLSQPLFDCLPHALFLAKLHAYGFDMKSLNLMYNYLSNRNQKVKLGGTYSSWQEILYRVPQGSTPGPLLFNTFLFDFLFFLKVQIQQVTPTIPHLTIPFYLKNQLLMNFKKHLLFFSNGLTTTI